MENEASRQAQSATALLETIRDRLAGLGVAGGEDAIRIIAASAQDWLELTRLDSGDAALGEDGLVRLALWSASKCCAALMGARHASLLLSEGARLHEVRCLVIAHASLPTSRPLSGFLLKPVEILDGRASRSAPGRRPARRAPNDIRNGAGGARLALFDAFPVGDDGEEAPFRGISSA